jgi:hypothetical protein
MRVVGGFYPTSRCCRLEIQHTLSTLVPLKIFEFPVASTFDDYLAVSRRATLAGLLLCRWIREAAGFPGSRSPPQRSDFTAVLGVALMPVSRASRPM